MTQSFNAIVPMACVTAAGIAAMVAEAFRDPGERMPIAGLGAVGLVGAGVASLLLWNHSASSFGVVLADNFGLFVTWIRFPGRRSSASGCLAASTTRWCCSRWPG